MNERYQPHTETGDRMPSIRPTTSHEKPVNKFEHRKQNQVVEVIENFEENTLKEIFLEMFQKSGNIADTINFIPFSDIEITYNEEDAVGSCSTEKIALNASKIANAREILWALIHEELHAVSNTPVETEIIDDRVVNGYRSGFSMTFIEAAPEEKMFYIDKIFTVFNEGVTELITDRIYKEYINRAGYIPRVSSSAKSVERTEQLKSEIWKYAPYRFNIYLCIELLSALSGVPSNTVEDSLIHGYFRNTFLIFPELEDALNNNEQAIDAFAKLFHNEDLRTNSESYFDFVKMLVREKIITDSQEIDSLIDAPRKAGRKILDIYDEVLD